MRLIDADEMILDLQHRCSNETFYKQVKESLIDCAPTVEAVSKVLFDQIKWERDIAIEQLEELGLSLGQKFGCEYCRFKRTSCRNMWCEIFDKIMPEDGYCCFFEFDT